jgi:hypothetical protein
MTTINSRALLREYCFRALGAPVVEINIADEQVEDRLDDALRFFSEYHFDGVEKVYLKYQVTAADITNGYIELKSDNRKSLGGGLRDSDAIMTANEAGAEDVLIENLVTSVTRIFPFTQQSVGMFDIRYQYALNDLYTFGTIDMVQYDLTQSYLTMLRQYLSPDKSVRFSRVQNKLYIDMNWSQQVSVGGFLIIECYRILDPRIYPEIYEDRLLKRYAVALFKRQWGINLSKYDGIKLPGDVVLRGKEIAQEAIAEIEALEKDIISKYELPADFIMG